MIVFFDVFLDLDMVIDEIVMILDVDFVLFDFGEVMFLDLGCGVYFV